PGEVGAEAEVRAGAAEADVGVRVAAHVEDVGGVEVGRVAVGGAVEHDEALAGGEVPAGQGDVLGGRAAHEHHRGGVAHDLLDRRGRGALEVVLPDAALLGVLGEELHGVADRRAGGVVPGHGQEYEERPQLLGRHHLVVDVGGDEGGGEVV